MFVNPAVLSWALITAVLAPATGGAHDFLAGPGLIILYGVLGFGFLYFASIRPQQRRAKEHQARIASIKRGDTIVLTSGMIGKVVRVEDQELGVEIAQNVTVKVVKTMVTEVRSRGEPAAVETRA